VQLTNSDPAVFLEDESAGHAQWLKVAEGIGDRFLLNTMLSGDLTPLLREKYSSQTGLFLGTGFCFVANQGFLWVFGIMAWMGSKKVRVKLVG
jgi:hypothetical protein